MVEQMLSSMKKRAASSCMTAMLTFRPKKFNRQMFNGTTGRKQWSNICSWSQAGWRCAGGVLEVYWRCAGGVLEVCSGLTGHLPQAADQQSLVVAAGKRDAVTQAVHQAVLGTMFSACVGDTQKVLLQKFGAAQHSTVIQEGGHKPAEKNTVFKLTSSSCCHNKGSLVPLKVLRAVLIRSELRLSSFSSLGDP